MPRIISEETLLNLLQLYRAGAKHADIARELGISVTTVAIYLRGEGRAIQLELERRKRIARPRRERTPSRTERTFQSTRARLARLLDRPDLLSQSHTSHPE